MEHSLDVCAPYLPLICSTKQFMVRVLVKLEVAVRHVPGATDMTIVIKGLRDAEMRTYAWYQYVFLRRYSTSWTHVRHSWRPSYLKLPRDTFLHKISHAPPRSSRQETGTRIEEVIMKISVRLQIGFSERSSARRLEQFVNEVENQGLQFCTGQIPGHGTHLRKRCMNRRE